MVELLPLLRFLRPLPPFVFMSLLLPDCPDIDEPLCLRLFLVPPDIEPPWLSVEPLLIVLPPVVPMPEPLLLLLLPLVPLLVPVPVLEFDP